jgi:hypothetical protein
MEAFLVSIATVGLAEMGDRTQLLSLILAAHYRTPWPILGGVLIATLANHALAGLVGVWLGELLTSTLLDSVIGVSMVGMALWTLKPDRLDDGAAVNRRSAFWRPDRLLRRGDRRQDSNCRGRIGGRVLQPRRGRRRHDRRHVTCKRAGGIPGQGVCQPPPYESDPVRRCWLLPRARWGIHRPRADPLKLGMSEVCDKRRPA